jgi:hypothetical protein
VLTARRQGRKAHLCRFYERRRIINNYPYDKAPAFFRVVSAELFFEAEAAEDAAITMAAPDSLASALDAVLAESAVR